MTWVGEGCLLQQQRHIETVEKYMEKTMYLISLQKSNILV
jgi:hypothetical protein